MKKVGLVGLFSVLFSIQAFASSQPKTLVCTGNVSFSQKLVENGDAFSASQTFKIGKYTLTTSAWQPHEKSQVAIAENVNILLENDETGMLIASGEVVVAKVKSNINHASLTFRESDGSKGIAETCDLK